MNGYPVERLNSFKLRKLVNETRGEKKEAAPVLPSAQTNLNSSPTGTTSVTRVPRIDTDLLAGEFFQRLFQEIRRGLPFPPEQAVNRVRTQIALATFIAEQHLAVASSQNERGAQARGPAADNENINLHQSPFRQAWNQ